MRTSHFLTTVVIGVCSLSLLNCGGGSSSTSSATTSTDSTATSSSTLALTTEVSVPASSSTASVRALTRSGPLYSVENASIQNGLTATVLNLSDAPDEPVTGEDGEDLGDNCIGTATSADGVLEFDINPDDISLGDTLVIQVEDAGISQLYEVDTDPTTATEILAPATDLSSTLAFEALRAQWESAGIDASNLGAIDLNSEAFSGVSIDNNCYVRYIREAFNSDLSDTGMAGQLGTMSTMFAGAYASNAGSFGSLVSGFFTNGTLDDETVSTMATQAADLVGVDADSIESLASESMNAFLGFGQTAASVVAADSEDNDLCASIAADTDGSFVQNAVTTMVDGASDFATFATTYGSTESVGHFMDVMANYQGPTAGTWDFTNFQPHAMATVFTQFIGAVGDETLEFDPDAIYGMMAYAPTSTDGAAYNPSFYESWGLAMFGTYEDTSASNFSTFDPGACSTYYSAQLIGGGLSFGADDLGTVNFAASDGYINFYQNTYQSGATVGGVSASACLTDPAACQTMFNAGGSAFDLSGHGFEYDDSLTEVYSYVPPSGTSGGGASDCGNGTCDSSYGESQYTCSIDCYDSSASHLSNCGNGTCDSGEEAYCFLDCQGEFTDYYAEGGTTGGTTTGGTPPTTGGYPTSGH